LRRRFIKAETTLFRIRYDTDDRSERDSFLASRDFDWVPVHTLLVPVILSHHLPQVGEKEKAKYQQQLLAATPTLTKEAFAGENYFKVNLGPSTVSDAF
jgi:DNA primase large subunit